MSPTGMIPTIIMWRFKSNHFGSDCTANDIKAQVKATAAQHRPRFYLTEFGLSRLYPSRDTMDEPLLGSDESAPEHRSGRWRLCNPFHTDIYCIGNVIRKEFMEVCDHVGYYHK